MHASNSSSPVTTKTPAKEDVPGQEQNVQVSASSPTDPVSRLSEYDLSSELGDGAYGTVLLGNHRATARTVAVKRMKNTYLTWKDALKEMEIIVASELKRHPNIIHMIEAFREQQQLYMVFEHMDCNLYQLMKERSIKRFTEPEVASISGQIFRGLQYLHEKGFFHRDMKPENILCNGTELVKLADFGQARLIRSRPPYTEYVSTRWYRAPELVLSSKVYNLGVDIWAVGCIMAEVVMLRPLFDGATAADQLFKIVKLLGTPRREEWTQGYELADKINMSFPQGMERQSLASIVKPCSVHCVDVIAATLHYNPQKRPSAKSCLHMSFFTRSSANMGTNDRESTNKLRNAKLSSQPLSQISPGSRLPALPLSIDMESSTYRPTNFQAAALKKYSYNLPGDLFLAGGLPPASDFAEPVARGSLVSQHPQHPAFQNSVTRNGTTIHRSIDAGKPNRLAQNQPLQGARAPPPPVTLTKQKRLPIRTENKLDGSLPKGARADQVWHEQQRTSPLPPLTRKGTFHGNPLMSNQAASNTFRYKYNPESPTGFRNARPDPAAAGLMPEPLLLSMSRKRSVSPAMTSGMNHNQYFDSGPETYSSISQDYSPADPLPTRDLEEQMVPSQFTLPNQAPGSPGRATSGTFTTKHRNASLQMSEPITPRARLLRPLGFSGQNTNPSTLRPAFTFQNNSNVYSNRPRMPVRDREPSWWDK